MMVTPNALEGKTGLSDLLAIIKGFSPANLFGHVPAGSFAVRTQVPVVKLQFWRASPSCQQNQPLEAKGGDVSHQFLAGINLNAPGSVRSKMVSAEETEPRRYPRGARHILAEY